MTQKKIQCTNCGHIPRDLPVSGSWFCPKCGKRSTFSHHRPKVTRKFYKKPDITRKSRDQITTKIYDNLTFDKSPDLGFKEPYINPRINPILPKKRTKLRIFFEE